MRYNRQSPLSTGREIFLSLRLSKASICMYINISDSIFVALGIGYMQHVKSMRGNFPWPDLLRAAETNFTSPMRTKLYECFNK